MSCDHVWYERRRVHDWDNKREVRFTTVEQACSRCALIQFATADGHLGVPRINVGDRASVRSTSPAPSAEQAPSSDVGNP